MTSRKEPKEVKDFKKAKKDPKKAGLPTKAERMQALAKMIAKNKATPTPPAAAPRTPPAKAATKEKSSKRSRNCSEPGCNAPHLTDQYCRLHYIKNWGSIISTRRAQARANLNKYIESVSEKYPDEYMEKIRDDLGSEGVFHARLRELGFREEYEATGGDNPFQMENFDEFVHGLKFEE